MKVESLKPILNVSNIQESFAWFEKIGWQKGWEWGNPPSFGGVCSGKAEIFLCEDGQGSRGGAMPRHVGDDDTGGVWMSWFLSSPAEVDAAHERALEHGLIVTMPPTNGPWGVGEFHLRHPDGHTFRVSAGTEEE
ncbi:MAG TPA: bleomycin resistance family protein [Pyrinomonadaceae bacterium]|nr:bleomycin resistance family protein [Pyrinomonadaceae bacterium]